MRIRQRLLWPVDHAKLMWFSETVKILRWPSSQLIWGFAVLVFLYQYESNALENDPFILVMF